MTDVPLPHDLVPAAHRPAFDPRRAETIRRLGLGDPDPELDVFARRLAEADSVPYAMINLVDHTGQHFVGVHAATDFPDPGRTMSLEEGFCPEVVARGLALVLPNLYAKPRYRSNPVVNSIGALSYCGAPVITPDSHITLGTLCTIGVEKRPQSTAQGSYRLITEARDELLTRLYQRAGLLPTSPYAARPQHWRLPPQGEEVP